MAGFWVVSLLSCLVALEVILGVDGCSCPEDSFLISRSEAIRRDFCFSQDVYSVLVLEATCNCIPGITLHGEMSALMNCHHYSLLNATVSNVAVLSRGECDLAAYNTYFFATCADLNSSFVAPGSLLEESEPGNVSILNLTTARGGCRLACPINERLFHYEGQQQQCIYTVRVRQVFRADSHNYSEDEEIQVLGPDTLTSCGDPFNRLQLGTEYIVGIGNPCSPIQSWPALSTFSGQEMELLQTLDGITDCGPTTSTPTNIATDPEATMLSASCSIYSTPVTLMFIVLSLQFF